MSDKDNAQFVPRNKSTPDSPQVVEPFKQATLGVEPPDKPDETVDGTPIPDIDES